MTGSFRAVLERYGQAVELFYEGAAEAVPQRAFVRAISDRTDEQRLPTPLGRARQDRFLFLGSPDAALENLGETGYILWNGGRYRARAAHPVYVGDAVNHWWALLEPLEEGEP